MIYPSNAIETFKIIAICFGCINFNDEFRIEKYLTCSEKKESYRDYVTDCCKFYKEGKRRNENN